VIRREIARFLIVGILTVLIDFLSYRGLVGSGLMALDAAKALGFIVGTLFSYFANRFFTFGHKSHMPGSVRRFALLYVATLGVNVLINSLALKVLGNIVVAFQLAFLIATGVSSCLNFLGMKFLVFKSSAASGFQ